MCCWSFNSFRICKVSWRLERIRSHWSCGALVKIVSCSTGTSNRTEPNRSLLLNTVVFLAVPLGLFSISVCFEMFCDTPSEAVAKLTFTERLLKMFTCIVKTPSSWEDSFFICSDKTCASSRIENSESAPQYPQERTRQSESKLLTASEPRPQPRCFSRKAAREVRVKRRDFSTVRHAMMEVGAGGTRSLSWWRNTQEPQGTTFTTLQRNVPSGTSL